MRVLFAGTPEVALPTLEALIASEHDVVGVLTRADARKGRGRALHPSPVAAAAREAGLDLRTPTTLKGEAAADVRAWVHGLGADVAVVVAYGRLIPADLLDVPGYGWLNLHFSLLPAWRGAAPVPARRRRPGNTDRRRHGIRGPSSSADQRHHSTGPGPLSGPGAPRPARPAGRRRRR